MERLTVQIETAAMLINLGVATVDKIKSFFADQGHDDAALAAILADVDQRLVRRA